MSQAKWERVIPLLDEYLMDQISSKAGYRSDDHDLARTIEKALAIGLAHLCEPEPDCEVTRAMKRGWL